MDVITLAIAPQNAFQNASRVLGAFTSPLFSFPMPLHTPHCHLWTLSSFYGLLTHTRSLPSSHLQCITSLAVITLLPFPPSFLAGLKPQVSLSVRWREHMTAATELRVRKWTFSTSFLQSGDEFVLVCRPQVSCNHTDTCSCRRTFYMYLYASFG